MTTPLTSGLLRVTARLAIALALGAALGSCYDSTAPEYADIGIRALNADNQPLHFHCTPLPLLPGATVVSDIELATGLTAHVLASQRFAEVTLLGTDDAEPPRGRADEGSLRLGYSAVMDVRTVAGVEYRVLLVGPCEPPPADAGP